MEGYIYHSKFHRPLILATDLLVIYASFCLSHLLLLGDWNFMQVYDFLFIVFCFSWWIVSPFSESTYQLNGIKDIRKFLLGLLSAFCVHIALVFVCCFIVRNEEISQGYLINLYVLSLLLVFSSRCLLFVAHKHYRQVEFGKFRKVIVVGAGKSGSVLFNFFQSSNSIGHRFMFMGFFDDDASASEHKNLVKGSFQDLKQYCLQENIDEIYFARSLTYQEQIDDLSKFADDNFICFRIVPDFSGIVQSNVNMYFLDSIPVITIRKEPLEIVFNKVIKRTFDIVFSLGVIIFIYPIVLPLIALAIKLNSKGPVFFIQMRPGKKNQLFKCYKFRTMYINNLTEVQATKNDSRITKVGRLLRKTNLDEFPQFFNVLLGDMSVVGPRPNMINQLEEYSKVIDKYKVRHFITPGITGYAQVNGFRGETQQLYLMEKRVEYDLMYMENWSFFLDIKIIFLTVWNVFKGEKNAY